MLTSFRPLIAGIVGVIVMLTLRLTGLDLTGVESYLVDAVWAVFMVVAFFFTHKTDPKKGKS